jgi:hypothetical protein
MEFLQTNRDFLRRVAKTRNSKTKNSIIAEASPEEILLLLEIAINTLRFRVKLTTLEHKKLTGHAEFLRKFARIRTEKKAREFLKKGETSAIKALVRPVLRKTK